MAEMIKMPVAERVTVRGRAISPWAPLGESLFRSLWIASVVSYTGTWMQNVGAGWLMTQMTMNPFMVGLVQAAGALPVFFVILPAGALADMVDRRRFLLVTQGWMVLASATLGILTLTSCVGPWVLLLFTFLLGLGSVMNDPAWQAITPELVPREQHASAVALNSAGFNVARAVGPALGGVVVAAVGSGTTFLLNAASFFGVILFLYRWQRPTEASAAGTDADYRATLRSARIWRVAGLLRIRRINWGGGVASGTRKVVGGWSGGGCDPGVCGHDVCFGTGADVCSAVCRDASGRRGMDRDPGLFECCGANDVSVVFAGASVVHVSAGAARRHGGGSDLVGSGREADRDCECIGGGGGGAGLRSVGAARTSDYG